MEHLCITYAVKTYRGLVEPRFEIKRENLTKKELVEHLREKRGLHLCYRIEKGEVTIEGRTYTRDQQGYLGFLYNAPDARTVEQIEEM